MYDGLLLARGGGLDCGAKLTPHDNEVTIAIGLGGTGIDFLETLKTKFLERVKPDDTDGGAPRYKHIRFLAMDSEPLQRGYGRGDVLNSADEFFDMGYYGRGMTRGGDVFGAFPDFREWLELAGFAESLNARAPTRQVGRALLMHKSREFIDRIVALMQSATAGLTNPTVNVHIIAGLGGSIGGGAFLDVCYLLRSALENIGAASTISGFFTLPDIYEARQLDHSQIAKIQAYSYAALKELDHCMGFPDNGDSWSQVYAHGAVTVTSTLPPVDLCHLISGTDTRGYTRDDVFDYARNAVAQYIIDDAAVLRRNAPNAFPPSRVYMENALHNVLHIPHGDDAVRKYCAIGLSAVVIPQKEAKNYLAARVIERIGAVAANSPTSARLDGFIKEHGLTFDALSARLLDGCDLSFPEPTYKRRDVKRDPELITRWFSERQTTAEANLMRNAAALSDVTNGYFGFHDATRRQDKSLVTQICKGLYALAADSSCGLHCAARLADGAAGRNLLDTFGGYITQAHENAERAARRRYEAEAEYSRAREAFEIRRSRKRYRGYVSATRRLCGQMFELRAYELLPRLLMFIREQLYEASRHLNSVRAEIDDIGETFSSNLKYLDAQAYHEARFERPITDLLAFRAELDAAAAAMDIPELYGGLIGRLFDAAETPGDGERGTEGVVRDFFDEKLEFCAKTMTEYLRQKYGTQSPDEISRQLYRDTVVAADELAEPLFWLAPGVNVAETSGFGYVTAPPDCAEAVTAASTLCNNTPHMVSRPTDESDRVSLLHGRAGFPLYTYARLVSCKEAYDRAYKAGLHIYSGCEYNGDDGERTTGRDWSAFEIYIPPLV